MAPGTVNPTVYTVTFDLAGGDRTGGGELTQTIAEGSSATAPTATRAGYTFDGWDKDFSNVTADMTVTALWTQNEIVVKDPEQYRVTVTYNSDGTLSCKLDMPLAKFDPSKMAGISAAISGLTNPSFGYVGTGGNLVTLTPRAADDPDPLAPPYLRIQGTAADEAALASAELSSLTYWLEGDATTYVQTFAPPLKLADMPTTYTNDPPGEDDNSENENKSSGGGGCTTGVPFGIATLLAAAAAKIAAKRRK